MTIVVLILKTIFVMIMNVLSAPKTLIVSVIHVHGMGSAKSVRKTFIANLILKVKHVIIMSVDVWRILIATIIYAISLQTNAQIV